MIKPNKVMDVSNRLQQIVEYLNITPNAFALSIKVSQPRFSNYLKGRAPDFETLNRICITYVMLDERWILTGEGEMLKIDESQQTVEQALDRDERSRLVALLESQQRMLESQEQTIKTLVSAKGGCVQLEGNAADADVI